MFLSLMLINIWIIVMMIGVSSLPDVGYIFHYLSELAKLI